ncbi:flavin reductase [Micromonospora sp. NPDC048839]|uniref:flavin reductase n=1 Tax=Micromonospora sp. NPDC048839 TaxID=3155641 RepID=UPI0033EE5C47
MMSEVPTTVRAAQEAEHARGQQAVATLDRRLNGQHTPHRPQWDCGACGQDWPCDPARVRLAETYGRDRVGLAMYLGAVYAAAVDELPATTTGETWTRFVGWVR